MRKRDLTGRLLRRPEGFDLFQSLVGAPRSKEFFVKDNVRAKTGDRILDLGCGTGAMRGLLPPAVTYVGVDIEPAYVATARARFAGQGRFVCADVRAFKPDPQFDTVIAYGVMHHLDDEGVRACCRVSEAALAGGGRVLFAEPCRTSDQGRFEKAVMDLDRGRHIRTVEGYLGLMREQFESVASEILPRGYRIPYTMVVLEARR